MLLVSTQYASQLGIIISSSFNGLVTVGSEHLSVGAMCVLKLLCAAAPLRRCAALLRCCFLAPVRCCAAALLLGFACASALLRRCAVVWLQLRRCAAALLRRCAVVIGCTCAGALLRRCAEQVS